MKKYAPNKQDLQYRTGILYIVMSINVRNTYYF